MSLGVRVVGSGSSARESRRSAGCFGSTLIALGCVVCWAGVRDHGWASTLSLVGVGLLLVGWAIALVPWIFPGVESVRLFGAVVTGALALGCLVLAGVAATRGEWKPVLLLVPIGLLWGVGTALCLEPELGRRIRSGRQSRLLGGLAALLAGLAISALVALGGVSEGVPAWVGAIAGLPFLLVGLLLLGDLFGWRGGGLVHQILVALLFSSMAAVAVGAVGGLGLAAVLVSGPAWLAVYRTLHRRWRGRDPLEGRPESTQLAAGCLVGLLLALVVVGAFWLASRPPAPPSPAEAPDPRAAPPR